jgi:hypothetical protein
LPQTSSAANPATNMYLWGLQGGEDFGYSTPSLRSQTFSRHFQYRRFEHV